MSLNWRNAGAGALSGAGLGANLGPWGAAAGGLLGAGLGLFGGGAKHDKLQNIPAGTDQQQALHNNILSQAMGMSQGGGYSQAQDYYKSLFQPGNQAYQNFAAPYLNQFQEQILPQIAERFAGAGALSSSGFGQALGGAGAGLQSQLAQLFAQLQSQAAGAQTNQFNQLSQTGLNYQPFAYNQQEGSMGLMGPLFAKLLASDSFSAGISSLFKEKPKPDAESGIGKALGIAPGMNTGQWDLPTFGGW